MSFRWESDRKSMLVGLTVCNGINGLWGACGAGGCNDGGLARHFPGCLCLGGNPTTFQTD